ncbi:hypothetical protein B0T16DRAFT_408182 [Cercophora newfieldiana]|uniref:Uncharacterized protein n=1 Tax=Cercophora newfieldiana TaxID=92897 RepID=A0AA40CT57_9PEZI|nr:hypothetical protein B0T16DRAFT_408182 [Cercophora newfieldiana]
MDPGAQPEQPRPADPLPAATEATPLLPRSDATVTPPPPVPRLVLIGHWITAIGGPIVAALAIAIFIIVQFHSPPRYHLPYGIQDFVIQMIFAGFLSTIWATASIFRVRQLGLLMPPLVAVIMHGVLAVWSAVTSIQGMISLARNSQCYDWGYPDPDDTLRCWEFASRISVLLWVYLGAVLVIGLVHTALLIFTCSVPFRGVSWRESLNSWKFPTGQLTVEFTIKFLRQEHSLPPPVPSQNVAPAADGA